MNHEILSKAANQARGLAIDAIHACNSGHLGLPLGSAEIGAVLFGQSLQLNPAEPRWINRDRFILSGGHGSMFIYSWLHLAGYDLSIEELKNFRKLHSKTPGHPEFGETVGVEATSGPLGQGIANAVGMAVAGKMSAAKFNTADQKILDYHVVALGGDGCLQEGVCQEASAVAGHMALDNLIVFYDSNDVTLDAMADASQCEDTAKRYEAMGWDVVTVDGHDIAAVGEAFEAAKQNDNGKPTLIIAKTEIGRGIPEVAGTAAGHGEGGAKFADSARKGLGLPEEKFFVSDDVKEAFSAVKSERASAYDKWLETYNAWKSQNSELAALLEKAQAGERMTAEEISAAIPEFNAEKADATRGQGGVALNAVAQANPLVITGSADLFGSTKNYLKDMGEFTKDTPEGRNIRFGIREHAMGAMVNGMSYDGIWEASGATFLVFADYLRPSIRIAALANLSSLFYFTHDSVGVGEDGPTHQPVETTSSLRCIPNLDVIRPADGEEVAGAVMAAFSRKDGPSAFILSRQGLPQNSFLSVADRREGVLKGAYIAVKETAELETILLASGSELQHAVEAAKELGAGTRVVSVPCMERFDRQDAAYKAEVLPDSCKKRVAIEAGISEFWYKYVGTEGEVIGIDRFGISAPGNIVMEQLGMTSSNVVDVVRG